MFVFVYGTLTDPDRVAALFEDEPGEYAFVEPAVLEGVRRAEGRYPTLVPGGSVEGRLLAVDERALERLDRYEGVDRGLYVRVPVAERDGRRVWTYVGDPDRLGVDADDAWPDDRPLRDAVRSYVTANVTVVGSDE